MYKWLRRMFRYMDYMKPFEEGCQKLPDLPGASSCLFHDVECFGRNLSGDAKTHRDMIQRESQGQINSQDVDGSYHLKPYPPWGGNRLAPRGNYFWNPQGQLDI